MLKVKSFYILLLLIITNTSASTQDSVKINYSKLYSHTLDADVTSALKLLEYPDSLLKEKDVKFKKEFELRFKNDKDNSEYINTIDPALKPLLKLYSEYWHRALKSDATIHDSSFTESLKKFLINNASMFIKSDSISDDDINNALIGYCGSLGFTTTGYAKTGKLFDLLVWKSQYDSIYTFAISDDTINVNVTFMENFATLGWEEYATLGKYYPGGWANDKGLFCVKSAYDLQSEEFLISYLAHEGRHFKDYELLPNLDGTELEYRAKLTELTLADKTLYNTIEFFLNNAIKESDNSHARANYLVIDELSKEIFDTEFITDTNKWKSVSKEKINSTSSYLFNKSTKSFKEKYGM
ncbi:MAG: hypothetical protein WC139_10560 [Candidatus Kapaibacterium sp.]